MWEARRVFAAGGWAGWVVTQQSDPTCLSGPAHTPQTEDFIVLGRPSYAHLRCSCAQAHGGLQLRAGGTLVFLWQLRCDGIWFILEFDSGFSR